jgi:dipeptidyl aminopeptidase/acylaminoacyl peptidase
VSAVDLTQAFESASGGEFLAAADKHELHQQQTPLYIVGVEPNSETRFGAQTLYYVKSAKWGRDEQKILAFTHNAYRERQALAILTLINSASKPGGPVYLGSYRTTNGHDAWELRGKPQESPTRAPAATTPIPDTPSMPEAPSVDDDLPF